MLLLLLLSPSFDCYFPFFFYKHLGRRNIDKKEISRKDDKFRHFFLDLSPLIKKLVISNLENNKRKLQFSSYLNPEEFERYLRYKNKKINCKTDEENYNFNYLDEIYYSNKFHEKDKRNTMISKSIPQRLNSKQRKDKDLILRNSCKNDFGPTDITEMLEEIFLRTKMLEKTIIGIQRIRRINSMQVNSILTFIVESRGVLIFLN